MDRMKTIGIVGGVASGKSAVAKLFVELGAGLLDADRAGHEVLAHDAKVQEALVSRWGPSVLAPDGSIDRAAVAACVFAPGDKAEGERKFLESVLHVRIRQQLDTERSKYAAAGCPAVVLDAPLLLEAGWGPLCDLLVMVDSPQSARLARALERGWTKEEFFRRESAQWSVDDKRRQANVLVTNDGTLDELREAVREVWQRHILPPT
jgi:dephospho-CoA kinase